MIDEKKIEEAAQGAADLYEQDLPIMSYYEDTEVDGQHHFCQEFGAELFKDGVNWAIKQFLKDLWHDAKEEPMSNLSPILFDGRDREGWQIVKTSLFRSSPWKQYCHYYGIIRWAYLEDLLPKEEGEE